MYQETYEEYIRSILGYPNYQMASTACPEEESNAELEDCYPEIYRVVYPMINKACYTNTKPISSELIDELTNEIYTAIENDHEINVAIHLTNEVGNNTTVNRTTANSVRTEKQRENRGENRVVRNRSLQDLIRILLIRELLGKPGNRPPRPPMPPQRPPMRPPFPGGSVGPRPPIMPRDLYEI